MFKTKIYINEKMNVIFLGEDYTYFEIDKVYNYTIYHKNSKMKKILNFSTNIYRLLYVIFIA